MSLNRASEQSREIRLVNWESIVAKTLKSVGGGSQDLAKRLIGVHPSPTPHWVGDGFPVRTAFSVGEFDAQISPFLLLDFAGPFRIEPTATPRGVDEHPHKGFETVTVVYQGEVEHRDSAGNEGSIGPGDVQWMTAGSGIVHEEKHARKFAERGGILEMAQLWVNLPAKCKGTPPAYQTILQSQIPVVELPGSGQARIIAGELHGQRGPAKTFTFMNVWDLRLRGGGKATFEGFEGRNLILYVVSGRIGLERSSPVMASDVAIFTRDGDRLGVDAFEDSKVLLLSGDPIDEPVVAHGPFVMNTREEIVEAVREYRSGAMGNLR